jgi:hypothetical protein
MKTSKKQAAYKLGVNRTEPAHRWRKSATNFKQSRDDREDRGTRQNKSVAVRATLPAFESAPRVPRKRHHV